MERRKLDLDVRVSEEQWSGLVQRADALGPEGGGFTGHEGEVPQVGVYLRDEDAPNGWRDIVQREEWYGDARREAARFRFNDGRPYAEIRLDDTTEQPVELVAREAELQEELESWIRGKWHELMEESGIAFDRGHVPED